MFSCFASSCHINKYIYNVIDFHNTLFVKVCFESDIEVVLRCGHASLCCQCFAALLSCPIRRCPTCKMPNVTKLGSVGLEKVNANKVPPKALQLSPKFVGCDGDFNATWSG